MEFDRAVAFVLEKEGGYVFHPKDPGGETNFGISKRAYPSLDIPALTKAEATAIYRRDYWDAISVGSMPAMLRLAVFDAAVNQGPSFAIGSMQALLGVKVDGVPGPKTLAALSACLPSAVLGKYIMRRHAGYVANSRWGHFGAGWSARILELVLFQEIDECRT